MKKKGLISNFKSDSVFRTRFILVFTTIWAALMFVYYLLVGYFATMNRDHFVWSYFYSLSLWYAILMIFKIILIIKSGKLYKGKDINFKSITVVYLFINFIEVLLITITPSFTQTVFQNKFNGFTISSLVINAVNIVLFIISWVGVNKAKFSDNEAEFLQTRKILARTEAFFNIMIITINILILLKQSDTVISYTYLGIGTAFALYSFIQAIVLIKKRKKEKIKIHH